MIVTLSAGATPTPTHVEHAPTCIHLLISSLHMHDQTNYVLQTNYTILRQLLPLHTRKTTTYKNLSTTLVLKEKNCQ